MRTETLLKHSRQFEFEIWHVGYHCTSWYQMCQKIYEFPDFEFAGTHEYQRKVKILIIKTQFTENTYCSWMKWWGLLLHCSNGYKSDWFKLNRILVVPNCSGTKGLNSIRIQRELTQIQFCYGVWNEATNGGRGR